MEKLYYFKLNLCPYCIRADRYIKRLIKENPEYQKINLHIINEAKDKDIADAYDYYLVPAFFFQEEKLHEGAASLEDIKRVFDQVLEKTKQ